jgi:hypothetical protein
VSVKVERGLYLFGVRKLGARPSYLCSALDSEDGRAYITAAGIQALTTGGFDRLLLLLIDDKLDVYRLEVYRDGTLIRPDTTD